MDDLSHRCTTYFVPAIKQGMERKGKKIKYKFPLSKRKTLTQWQMVFLESILFLCLWFKGQMLQSILVPCDWGCQITLD